MNSSYPEALIPSVPVVVSINTVDGIKEFNFKLAYDFNALPLVEEKIGTTMLNGGLFARLTTKAVAVLLWAGVQRFHPEFAGEEGLRLLSSWLTIKNSETIQAACQEAYILSLSDEQQAWIRAEVARRVDEAKAKFAAKQAGATPLDVPAVVSE